jgi:hypothetical protein
MIRDEVITKILGKSWESGRLTGLTGSPIMGFVMFDQLSDRLQKVMKFLRGEGRITESNMTEALKQIRLAFLEADVNYKVVKDFESWTA